MKFHFSLIVIFLCQNIFLLPQVFGTETVQQTPRYGNGNLVNSESSNFPFFISSQDKFKTNMKLRQLTDLKLARKLQATQSSENSSTSSFILNCRVENFESKMNEIELPTFDSWMMVIFSPIAIAVQFVFILLSFKQPQLLQQPGDMLVGASFAETILCVHWFISGLQRLINPDQNVEWNSIFCQVNSGLNMLGNSLLGLYAFAFFFFIGSSLKNSLQVKGFSRKKIHLGIWCISALIVSSFFLNGSNGKSLYGLCSDVINEQFPMFALIVFISFVSTSVILLTFFARRVPNTKFYKKKRNEFLQFSVAYLTTYLIFWGISALSNTILYLNCSYIHSQGLIIVSTLYNISQMLASLIIPLLRLKDPYLRVFFFKKSNKSQIEKPKQEKQEVENENDLSIFQTQTTKFTPSLEIGLIHNHFNLADSLQKQKQFTQFEIQQKIAQFGQETDFSYYNSAQSRKKQLFTSPKLSVLNHPPPFIHDNRFNFNISIDLNENKTNLKKNKPSTIINSQQSSKLKKNEDKYIVWSQRNSKDEMEDEVKKQQQKEQETLNNEFSVFTQLRNRVKCKTQILSFNQNKEFSIARGSDKIPENESEQQISALQIKNLQRKCKKRLTHIDQIKNVELNIRNDPFLKKNLVDKESKQRLQEMLFSYFHKSELQFSQSPSLSLEKENSVQKSEKIAFELKIEEIVRNADMIDALNDPFYKNFRNKWSVSSSKLMSYKIDDVFGYQDLDNKESIKLNSLEDQKEHFIRILQRNVKMGVLVRIISGIQLHCMRSKKYCSKLHVFRELLDSKKQKSKNKNVNNNLKGSMIQNAPYKLSLSNVNERAKSENYNKNNKINMHIESSKEFSQSCIRAEQLEGPPFYQQNQYKYEQHQDEIEVKDKLERIPSQTIEQRPNQQSIFENLNLSDQPECQLKDNMIHFQSFLESNQLINSSSVSTIQKIIDDQEIYREVKVYSFSDNAIKENIKNVPSFLKDNEIIDKINMKVYSPLAFNSLQMDLGENALEASFDLQLNASQISGASGGDGGKSGQFFFFTYDNKYLLKTITQKELEILLDKLPQYFKYLKSEKESTLARIIGLYSFQGLNNSKVIHLVLMKSIANCPRSMIHRTYDLKGSSFDRQVLKNHSKHSSKELSQIVMKDSDFTCLEEQILINPNDSAKLYEQLESDALFLESLGFIDYSLIVFKLNKLKKGEDREEQKQQNGNFSLSLYQNNNNRQMKEVHTSALYHEIASNHQETFEGFISIPSIVENEIEYHLGIIDYLQLYDFKKKCEKFAKRIINLNPKLDTSSQDPITYRKRFLKFMKKILSYEEVK